SWAGSVANTPLKAPIGVRAALTMTILSLIGKTPAIRLFYAKWVPGAAIDPLGDCSDSLVTKRWPVAAEHGYSPQGDSVLPTDTLSWPSPKNRSKSRNTPTVGSTIPARVPM